MAGGGRWEVGGGRWWWVGSGRWWVVVEMLPKVVSHWSGGSRF